MNTSENKTYICIDLKSFYASVECASRGLDPFKTNLVVADPARTEKTICLAITPAMKALGVPNRCRVFEIPKGINYIMAPPRMKHYMEVSTQIVGIYLSLVSPEDLFVYSIDECFIDATPYLSLYNTDARGFAHMLRKAVEQETSITATAGIGTNLFLAKVALDITAKHVPDGIGMLDEALFRKQLWHHRPITDVWNIGPGIARRLRKYRVFDLKGITEIDVDVLYKEFGVNAEYLIDHAWGIEPCTIEQIKKYQPKSTSVEHGQVLSQAYSYSDAHLILHEMIEESVLDLVEKGLVSDVISLRVFFERKKKEVGTSGAYGEYSQPYYKELYDNVSTSKRLPECTNSISVLLKYFDTLWEEKVHRDYQIRRMSVGFGNLQSEIGAKQSLFNNIDSLERERNRQKALVAVRKKYGKNALLKGTSLTEKSTVKERNRMVGGHRG